MSLRKKIFYKLLCKDQRKLVDSLHQLMGDNVRIEVEETDCIETTAAGKHRFIVSSVDMDGGLPCRTPASTP